MEITITVDVLLLVMLVVMILLMAYGYRKIIKRVDGIARGIVESHNILVGTLSGGEVTMNPPNIQVNEEVAGGQKKTDK